MRGARLAGGGHGAGNANALDLQPPGGGGEHCGRDDEVRRQRLYESPEIAGEKGGVSFRVRTMRALTAGEPYPGLTRRSPQQTGMR